VNRRLVEVARAAVEWVAGMVAEGGPFVRLLGKFREKAKGRVR
jgi:hypothetical protein